MGEMLNKKKNGVKTAVKILTVLIVITAFFCGFFLRDALLGRDAAALSEIAAYLKEFGVFDSTTLELKEFTAEDAARLIANNLPDDYSKYYTKEEYDKLKRNSGGNYQGVGVSVYTGTNVIAWVYVNSPAFYAGIKKGDLLKAGKTLDGERTDFSSMAEVSAFLSKVGESEFYFVCEREGEELDRKLKSAPYETSYLTYYDDSSAYAFLGEYGKTLSLTAFEGKMEELPSDTAYISFMTFEGGAAGELAGMLGLMKEKGKTKLIFDLRDNGGGYMNVLEGIAESLIYNEGKTSSPVAYSKNNKGSYSVYKTGGNTFYTGIEKIAVIANENTASASECLIGAMLYYKDAFDINSLVIENEELEGGVAKTYGKGIMQTTFDLTNGGAIKLTTAVIYQPDKATCIHGGGITVSGQNALLKSEGKALARAIEIVGA